jgi:hypothetical protein
MNDSCRLAVTMSGETLMSDWEKRDVHPEFGFGANFKIELRHVQESPDVFIRLLDKLGFVLQILCYEYAYYVLII